MSHGRLRSGTCGCSFLSRRKKTFFQSIGRRAKSAMSTALLADRLTAQTDRLDDRHRATVRGRGNAGPMATTSPAGAGPVLARNQLRLAARESESGEAEGEKRESGGFGDRLADRDVVPAVL